MEHGSQNFLPKTTLLLVEKELSNYKELQKNQVPTKVVPSQLSAATEYRLRSLSASNWKPTQLKTTLGVH